MTVLCLAFAGLSGACSDSPATVKEAIAVAIAADACLSGTTLVATKTAEGFFRRDITHDCATHDVVRDTSTMGAQGHVCVTNGGDEATENLRIVDQVRCESCPGVLEDVPGAGFTLTPESPLQPGETRCFEYVMEVPAGAGVICRNTALVTITNYTGHLGEELGPEADADFTLPLAATTSETTGECAAGCTRTIGFWKTHAGLTGNNPDLVSQYLPILLGAGGGETVMVTSAAQAASLLGNSGDASNGINKLYAQLLGAKLDVASGASSSAAASSIGEADAFLVMYGADDWGSLSSAQKQQVLGWKSTLDAFNNGIIGPGHCG